MMVENCGETIMNTGKVRFLVHDKNTNEASTISRLSEA